MGLTTAACLAQIGHKVFCSESDEEKLHKLQNGIVPIFEPGLDAIVGEVVRCGRLVFGSTVEGIHGAQIIFICVGTPPLHNGDADLSAIESLARFIAAACNWVQTDCREKYGSCADCFSGCDGISQRGARREPSLTLLQIQSFFERVRLCTTSYILTGSSLASKVSGPSKFCANSTHLSWTRPLFARYTKLVPGATIYLSWSPIRTRPS